MAVLKEQKRHCRQPGDRAGLSRSLGNEANIYYVRGELDAAMVLHKEAERLCRELGDKAGLHATLGNQALILQDRGELDAAMALHKEKERLCRELGDPSGLAISMINQASILGLKMGRVREALPLAEEAVRLANRHGLSALARQIQTILEELRLAERSTA